MTTFNDNKNQKWIVQINIATVKRVRQLIDFDLSKLIGVKNGNIDCTNLNLLQDDIILCVNLIEAICFDEIKQRKLSSEDFANLLNGDVLDDAVTAIIEEFANFSSATSRMMILKCLKKTKEEVARTQAEVKNLTL